jgi:tRNA (guanine37-N1)-methyltransferase
MRFDILSLFPSMVTGFFEVSILKRAQEKGILSIHVHDIRNAAQGKHRSVDDTPYGGGAGMVLRVDVLHTAMQQVETEVEHIPKEKRQTILLCPQGRRFLQSTTQELTQYQQITLICGHYEGFDERIRAYVDREISIGDFVLTGGELPAACIVDAVSRLLPGAIHAQGPEEESFSLLNAQGEPQLEYPHYTKPPTFDGVAVPDILLSGNHAAIQSWRMQQAQQRTNAKGL